MPTTSGQIPALWSAEAAPTLTEPAGMFGPQDTYQLERRLAAAGYAGRLLRKGFLELHGPFPVAGSSTWSDDWHAYRPCPTPHLHQGLDIFAARGTPIVAVGAGVVASLGTGAISGLAVKITDAHGVQYFYGHLDGFAAGLRPGQRVRAGQVLGYVGNSGDAAGGPTHVHFEVLLHGLPTPPKAYVDRWLLVAEARAARLNRTSKGGDLPASPPAHRDAYAAGSGEGAAMVEAETMGLRNGSDASSFPALAGIFGGMILVLGLLGLLRGAPRRREIRVAADDPTRPRELLEALFGRPDEPSVALRTWAATPVPDGARVSTPIGSDVGADSRVEAPRPPRARAGLGFAVIALVAAATWSRVR